jgi:hypothetical protein
VAATFTSVPLAAQPSYGGGSYQGSGQYQGSEPRYGSGQYHSGDYSRWDGNAFWRGAPNSTWERIAFLQNRIDQAARDGYLDRRDARRANAELRRIRQDAKQMRRHRGGYGYGQEAALQQRLDDLSRNLRWLRYSDRWSNGYERDAYATDYDATRYYRSGSQYRERRLSAADEVYRGSDGRYYCKRSDGTTGLVIGAVAGGVVGNVIDGGHNRLAGTLIGGALGALAGRAIDQSSDVRCT